MKIALILLSSLLVIVACTFGFYYHTTSHTIQNFVDANNAYSKELAKSNSRIADLNNQLALANSKINELESKKAPVTQTQPATQSPTATSVPTITSHLPVTTLPVIPTATKATTATMPPAPVISLPTTPQVQGVKFILDIVNVSGSGLSRTITAQVSNTGNMDAHNVQAKLEAFTGSSSISISGQKYLVVDIGLLQAGSSITKQVGLSFGLLDGLAISSRGAQLKMTMSSDEKTEVFTYDYTP